MIYRERLEGAARAVVLAVRGRRQERDDAEIRDMCREVGADEIMRVAEANQVAALVATRLRSLGDLPVPWIEVLDRNEARVRSLIASLERVVQRLDAIACPTAAIEGGGVLLDSGLPTSGYCPGDIDVLYQEGRGEEVFAAFDAEGFKPVHRRSRLTRRTEFRRTREDGTAEWLEAGAHPFDRMWVPLPISDRSQIWLASRRASRKSGIIHVLDPTHALVQVSLHTSLHSFVRAPGLRLHVDIDRLVVDHGDGMDWTSYVDEVRRVGIGRRAFVSLAMASAILETPIPEDVLRALAPKRVAVEAIARLLTSAGVMSDGRRKLPGVRALALDYLLDDKGAWSWMRNAASPSAVWLREHFDREATGASAWRLRLRRLGMLATRWRPE